MGIFKIKYKIKSAYILSISKNTYNFETTFTKAIICVFRPYLEAWRQTVGDSGQGREVRMTARNKQRLGTQTLS